MNLKNQHQFLIFCCFYTLKKLFRIFLKKVIETHVKTYNYSNDGRISEYTISGDFTSNTIYNYDVLDRLSSVVYNNIEGKYSCTISKSYSYLNSPTYGETSLVETFTSTVGDTTVTHTYTYDDSGNITKITYSDGRVIEYEYDNLGQLISEDNDITNEYCTYTYDNAGNLVETICQLKDAEETIEIVQNSYSYTDSEWGDLLTAFNGTAITYDEIGNPINYYNGSSYTFGWEGRRLVSASINGKNISFTYNEDGLRTSKTVDGVTRYYVYDGSLLISEYTNDEALVYLYDANNEPIGFKYYRTTATSSSEYTFWYEKNLQGDIISICANNGMKIVTYKYNTWGEPSIESYRSAGAMWAMRNNLKYRGYYYDRDLGMYYLQSRYYDPATCRFISPDSFISTGQGILGYNMYAYCNNNPVMGYDPTGHLNWGIFASGIGQVLVGAGAIVAATTVLACSSVPAAMLAIASITFVAGALTVTNGVSEIAESVTGHNYVRDDIMGGNTEAYETYKEVTQTVSSIGASICTAYYMYNGGNICFVAGTLVKAENRDIAIEDIRIGDKVYAYNDETGEIALKSVVNTFVNEATELVHVFVNNEEIICTNEHPFYSPVKGWTEACQLRAGDILVSLNGEYVIVEKVQHEILESPIKVYNFEVEDFHTYYVGNGDGVLVHNDCSDLKSFKTTQDLEDHFNKHGSEFEGLYNNSQEYLSGANYVIDNGTYVPEMNGYVRFFGANGGANYAFVGLTQDSLNITTFSIRSVDSLNKIPWIQP